MPVEVKTAVKRGRRGGQYPIAKVLSAHKQDGVLSTYVEWVVSFVPLSED